MEPRAAQLLILLGACARPLPVSRPLPAQGPPHQALSWYLRGALLREEGAPAEAARAFGEAAFFDLADPTPLVAQSEAALAQGAPDRALTAAAEALDRAPGDPAALRQRARALLALGRPAEAVDAARQSADPAVLIEALLADGQREAACAAAQAWSATPPRRGDVFARRSARQRACDPPAG